MDRHGHRLIDTIAQPAARTGRSRAQPVTPGSYSIGERAALTRHRIATVILAGLLTLESTMRAGSNTPTVTVPSTVMVERHHYSMSARVRPLLVFWISRSGVGDAVVTKRRGPDQSGYSLLIGSDPDRAPRRINRWGYIDEELHGAEAHIIGGPDNRGPR